MTNQNAAPTNNTNAPMGVLSIEDVLNTRGLKSKWAMALADPYYWVKYFLSPKVFSVFNKHPKQIQFLREAVHSEEMILSCGSRSGKTFTLGLLHLWFLTFRVRPTNSFFYNDYSKTYQTLNASLTLNQAKIVFDNILELVYESPFYTSFPFVQKIERGQTPYILTCLNSKFEARPTSQGGINLQGKYYDFISLDEAASEKNLNYLRYKTIGSRRSDVSGRLAFSSTPGLSTTFREYWQEYKDRKKKGDNVCLGRFSKFDNPINSHEFIYREMESMTQVDIEEQVYGRFSPYTSTFFNPQDLLLAFQPDLPLYIPRDNIETGDCDPYSYEPRNRHKQIHFSGLDTAGKGLDSTVLITLSYIPQAQTLTLVAIERVSKMGLLGANGIIERLKRRFANYGTENHHLFYDASSLGGGQLTEIMGANLTPEQYAQCTGINSSRKPGRSPHNHKFHFLSNLSYLLEKNRIIIPDSDCKGTEQLKKELRFYQYPDDDKLSTDCVMALSLAAYSFEYYQSDNPNMSPLLSVLNDTSTVNYSPEGRQAYR